MTDETTDLTTWAAAHRPAPSIDAESAIRGFLADEAAVVSVATAERYLAVGEALFDFLDVVDVRSRLGPELADHLQAERHRLGSGAFLPTLGLVSMIRVLPAFLADPWLPPRGPQRGSQRTVIGKLLTYVRRRALIDSAELRADFAAVRKALGEARGRDYDGWHERHEAETEEVLEVTVGLRSTVLDPLLQAVEEGRRESLADAMDAQLDPDRRYRDPYGWM